MLEVLVVKLVIVQEHVQIFVSQKLLIQLVVMGLLVMGIVMLVVWTLAVFRLVNIGMC